MRIQHYLSLSLFHRPRTARSLSTTVAMEHSPPGSTDKGAFATADEKHPAGIDMTNRKDSVAFQEAAELYGDQETAEREYSMKMTPQPYYKARTTDFLTKDLVMLLVVLNLVTSSSSHLVVPSVPGYSSVSEKRSTTMDPYLSCWVKPLLVSPSGP